MSRRIFGLAVLVLTALILLGGAATLAASPPSNQAESFTLTLNIPPLTWSRTADGYDVPAIEGMQRFGSPGDPGLLARQVLVALPPDVWWPSLQAQVIAAQVVDVDGAYQLEPVPPLGTSHDDLQVVEWGKNEPSIVDGKNVQVYGQATVYPVSPVLSVTPSQMRKWRLASILVTPLQVEPATGRVRLATQMTLQVSYQRSARAVQATSLAAELADTAMDDLVAPNLDNLDMARAWYPQAGPLAGTRATSQYVIVTSNAIYSQMPKSYIDAFANHKIARGLTVEIVTEDKYGSLQGAAPHGTAEKIRQWLRDNWAAKGIRYVLLIGDPTPDGLSGVTPGDVPMKMTHITTTTLSDFCYEEQPTDWYYADLSGDWDLNQDGRFGVAYVWPQGDRGSDSGGHLGADHSAEVIVGRIPVYRRETGWQDALQSILQKTIDYQNSGATSWRKQALLPMAFPSSYSDGSYIGQEMQDHYLTSRGYTSWTLYQHKGDGCNADYNSNEDLVNGAVRDKWKAQPFGLVTWFAHGWSDSASIGYDEGANLCDDDTLFSSGDTALLDNQHPAVVMQGSCMNGSPTESYNLGYSLLKRGAIATVSASRCTGYWLANFDASWGGLANQTFDYQFGERVTRSAAPTFGAALADLKQAGIAGVNDSDNWGGVVLYNLYGDPEVRLSDGHPWPPAAPANLQARPRAHNAIEVAWTDNSDNETEFELDWSVNGTDWYLADEFAHNVTQYLDQNSACGVPMYYRVLALNDFGNSSASQVGPVTPQNQDDYEPDDSAAQAAWTWATGAAQHRTFHAAGDADWIQFWAYPWNAYTMTTSSLGGQVNTILDLFDRDGTTLLTSNDNCAAGWASCIKNWRPAAAGAYYVRVRDANGQGGCTGYTYDLAVTESTNTSLPAAPSNLVAQNPTNYSINLSWSDNSSNEDGFRIERWGAPQSGPYRVPGWITVGAVGPNVNQWTDTSLTCNTTRIYRVSAYNATGQSSYTAVASASTVTQDRWEPDGTPAQAHTIALGSGPERHTFQVAGDQDWVKLSATTDRVYTITTSNLGRNSDTLLQLYDQDGATLLEWNDDCGGYQSCIRYWRPPADGIYYVQVQNVYAGGGCPGYEYDLAVTGSRRSITARPGLTPAAPSHSAVRLAWTYREPDLGFVVERRLVSQRSLPWMRAPWQRIIIVAPDVSQYDDTALGCGASYEYRIHALTSAGDSAYSQIVSVTTTLRDAFEPDGVYTQAHSIEVNGLPQYHNLYGSPSIDVDWMKFTAVKNEIYTITLKGVMTTTVISYTMMQLYDTNGTTLLATAIVDPYHKGAKPYIRFQANPSTLFATYYVRVTNTRGGGCPGYDYAVSIVNSHYRDALPATPSALRVTRHLPDQIGLGWDFRGTANGFDIQRRYGNGWLSVGQVASGVTTFADENVSCGVPYEYRVAAIGAPGNSDYVSIAVPTLPCLYPVAYLPVVLRNP